jgi:hypothetical protein
MAFEVFTETRARTKEYISVTENFTFGLPRTFIDKQQITTDHKAVILYDADEKKIAIHFTLAAPKFGLAVRIPNDTQGGMVVAKSFFELKNIDPKNYGGRYYDFEIIPLQELGHNKDGHAYVIQLKEKSQSKQPVIDENTQEIVDEQIKDEPINLDDIPF